MLEELDKLANNMNCNQTKIMTIADEYKIKEYQAAEIGSLARAAFGYIRKNKRYSQYPKTQLYNEFIVPLKTNMNKVTVQRPMERHVLHLNY